MTMPPERLLVPPRAYVPRFMMSEIISIVGLIWCAYYLIAEPYIFLIGSKSALIAAMQGVAGQSAWAVFVAALGVAECASLAMDDCPRLARRVVCVIAVAWWGFVAGGIAYNDWRSPFAGICLALALTLIPRLRRG